MYLVPAPGPAGLDNERHREFAAGRAGAFHDVLDEPRGRLDLVLRRLDEAIGVPSERVKGGSA